MITGETIHFGYYRQDGITVEEDKKVIEVITDIADRIKLAKDHWISAAQFLRHFNFPNHTHNDRVAKLSGGEKRRLYLLTVLMKNPNFLILDEPTNDLDIETLNILEDFLLKFPGCLLIVSHDRYFLDRLSDHLFVFRDVGDIKDYPGNYTEFREKQKAMAKSAPRKDQKVKAPKPVRKRGKTGLSYKEQKEFETLEADIEALETEKSVLLEKMNAGTLPPDELMQASTRFEEIEAQLSEKSDRWLELSELL